LQRKRKERIKKNTFFKKFSYGQKVMLIQAIKKAKKSNCKYKIVAIGLNRKGDIVGFSTNVPRFKRFGGFLYLQCFLRLILI